MGNFFLLAYLRFTKNFIEILAEFPLYRGVPSYRQFILHTFHVHFVITINLCCIAITIITSHKNNNPHIHSKYKIYNANKMIIKHA